MISIKIIWFLYLDLTRQLYFTKIYLLIITLDERPVFKRGIKGYWPILNYIF